MKMNTMKESKRLFTKCISEMNSGKKLTSQGSPAKVALEGSSNTFKALKIQMIESVVPEDRPPAKRMPFMELKRAASAFDLQPESVPSPKQQDISPSPSPSPRQ